MSIIFWVLNKMEFNTNQILITGANGWLGKTFIDAMFNGIKGCDDLSIPQRKIKVKCLILPGEKINLESKNKMDIELVHGDITSQEDCDKFTHNSKNAILFHCAGIIHPSYVNRFYEINVDGTRNLFFSAIKNRIKRIVVISSNSPCGTNPTRNHFFNEESEYNPYFNYGKSKMLMEKLVINYVNKGDIEAVIIRPPWFYGPYQPNRQIRFYKMIREGKVPVVGDGLNNRSMACTINISQAMIRAAIKEEANGNIYWISDETPYSFLTIISTIRKVMKNEFGFNCSENNIKLPNLISEVAYYLDKTIQSLGFYNKEIHVLSEMNKNIACSIEKAKKELGYKPTIDLYEGTYLSIKSSLSEFD